jgi:hypothetical protein
LIQTDDENETEPMQVYGKIQGDHRLEALKEREALSELATLFEIHGSGPRSTGVCSVLKMLSDNG